MYSGTTLSDRAIIHNQRKVNSGQLKVSHKSATSAKVLNSLLT
ncbi:MAG: hypothetical protein RIB93_12440 [Coleofasciculus sp. D1-CHI-01]